MPSTTQSSLNLDEAPSEPSSSQNSADAHHSAPSDNQSPVHLAFSWIREKVRGRTEASLKDVIEEVLEDEALEHAAISTAEKNLLTNMMTFGELTIDDIMVPRTDIEAMQYTSSLEEIRKKAIASGHTRIPVYEETLDKIVGFIHVKDLLSLDGDADQFSMDSLMRNILFVPPSMRVLDLLMKMRVSGSHMAIVVDEYGGTDGLVTMEDLFEELVGEIQDEHDHEEEQQQTMRWVSEHSLEADARVPIALLEETFGERITEGDIENLEFDTLGGYIFYTLGRVPAKGEVIHLRSHLKIEILAADPRRIHRVRIIRLEGK
jgi:magnesium and cobalt transporter